MKMDFLTIQLANNEHFPVSENHRFLIVLKGEGRLVVDNNHYSFLRHDLLELPSHTICIYESNSSADSPILFGVIEMLDFSFTSHKILHIPASDTDLIRKLFYLALDVQGTEAPYLDAVRETLHRLVHESIIAAGLKAKAMNLQVFDVIREINENFASPDFEVMEAIQRTGYSANHLRKLFKEETGVTPTEFIIIRRMDRAAELFRQLGDRLPVREIALQCGYEDPYYFSRQFKAYYSVSPQKYIEQLKGSQPKSAG